MNVSAGRDVPRELRQDVHRLQDRTDERDRTVFLARLDRHWPPLLAGLEAMYGTAGAKAGASAVQTAARRFTERPADLRLLDLRRHVAPDWFQSPTMLGYAVMDFRQVRPDLGTMDDLAALTKVLRSHGISMALDLVLNHVAREHEWAVRARAGEERYRRYFHVYPDRTEPDRFEQSLPEVFPYFAPGNFTWDDDLDGWVWTTFNSWQWDLNWANPDVFAEFADIVCFLANQGAECLRLDAIAFTWKRLGTSCQNQPEVHHLTQALRAVARIAAPAVLFKAEAIVGPRDLMGYLGTGIHAGQVSDLAYHNSLMVQLWSALATGEARLATTALRRFAGRPATTAWASYVRCHDDIGWAIDDHDAASVGWDGFSHRRFLSDYYCGDFFGSPARGLVFQRNEATGDRRISGSTASLAGLESALADGDPVAVDLAVRRVVLLHLAMLVFGGLPLLWMGDEIALLNDERWSSEPGHAADNRWVHRPRMPWALIDSGLPPGAPGARVRRAIRRAVAVRADLPAMHGSIESVLLDPVNPSVLAWSRSHAAEPVVALHNVSTDEQWWPRYAVPIEGELVDALTGSSVSEEGRTLAAYDVAWLRPARALDAADSDLN